MTTEVMAKAIKEASETKTIPIEEIIEEERKEFERILGCELKEISSTTPLSKIKEILDKLVKTFPFDYDNEDERTSFLRWNNTFGLAVEVSEIKSVPFEVFDEFIHKFSEFYDGKLPQASFDAWVHDKRETFLLLLPPKKLTHVDEELLNELNKVAYDACMEIVK